MKIRSSLVTGTALTLLTTMMLHTAPVHAAANPSPSILLDGQPLSFQTSPVVENGYSFVPMRPIFEAEGAKVSWNASTQTITAKKEGTVLTYRIGEKAAYKNQKRLDMPVPAKVIDWSTLVPLRFISEALGNLVKWHGYSGSITISSAQSYETTIEYGVNLRDAPKSDANSRVLRMLPKDERIHVIREVDENWLEVQAKDDTIGFISAKPLYTDYTSSVLAEKQADELIAFGSKFIGTPYEFGAKSGQTNTFDCSSFVQHVFSEVMSIDLPRVSYDQALKGKEVGLDELRKGDLLFFSARGLDIGHVGIYAGDGRILHTFSKDRGVHIADFDDKWKKRFVTAKRVF
ncbi:stalk domain-containing protein [Paenibacillus mendelii]|uniref:Stalk domain-containing protein n=1 Tax=Paenibacillus mendelii TaxID=206163 RepID=A0ABV6J2G7_9BACL|nr:stalk domain-containing protein [Paenibacillus mendelii]MCQ6563293.1 stalk domain-containing protein [Paenibacillus mendelii]